MSIKWSVMKWGWRGKHESNYLGPSGPWKEFGLNKMVMAFKQRTGKIHFALAAERVRTKSRNQKSDRRLQWTYFSDPHSKNLHFHTFFGLGRLTTQTAAPSSTPFLVASSSTWPMRTMGRKWERKGRVRARHLCPWFILC